jgi:hypothetical protein
VKQTARNLEMIVQIIRLAILLYRHHQGLDAEEKPIQASILGKLASQYCNSILQQ